jgi:hypothetical protein
MFFKKKYFLSILIVVILIGRPTPAYAAIACSISLPAPAVIENTTLETITIIGSGDPFDSGATVSLVNFGPLTATVVSGTEITAYIRPGVPEGVYKIEVTNPGVLPALPVTAECSNSLTIIDPSPLPTATTAPFIRPQMIVSASGSDPDAIKSLKEFTFSVQFKNVGSVSASNTQVTFTSADLIPTNTGGVVVLGTMGKNGGVATASQSFVSSTYLDGKTVVSIDATVTYYDAAGTAYTDKFVLSVPVSGSISGGGSAVTSTPTGVRSGQLIIPSYGTTVDPLQPGTQFTLTMTVQNAGNDKAQRVTMIVGGGSSGGGGETPQPGGVSGGSGEFTNFAPVGTSNIQSLGDLGAGEMRQVKQDLIVNVSTNPGAYPMKITFSYLNNAGEVVNDEQVITLLVFSLPNVEVNFYRPPDLFFQGQPGALPVQVVNLGKRTSILGNIKITSKDGIVDGGETLIGALDAGGYFTLDAMFIPDVSGELELNVLLEYVDDFNQSRTVERTLKVTVEEAFVEPTLDPSLPPEEGGEFIPVSDETFFQKTWRFVLGLFGLDSAPPPPPMPEFEIPKEEFPAPISPDAEGSKG